MVQKYPDAFDDRTGVAAASVTASAVQQGLNTFYVYSVDKTDHVGPSATATMRFDSQAPSTPGAVTAIPPNAGDIRIRFGAANHGDPFPFPAGAGGILAHAFYPPPNGGTRAGDSHFDDAETWSLTGAAGKVYIAGRNGTTVVLRHGPKYEVLATNKLDEGFDASPVIVGKQIFLRGGQHLYCIAEN